MSATPALRTLERAANVFASYGVTTLAAELRTARLELAELLDAADAALDELDHRTHGLSDTTADHRLRRAVTTLRPSTCMPT